MASRRKTPKPFDTSKYLDSDEAIAAYITEALATNEQNTITRAVGVAAQARGMSEIARETGLSRESLYKALGGNGRPQFETVNLVLKALGLRLRAEPARGGTKGKRAA